MALVMGEKFPRAALLEALYRFVTEDLNKRRPAPSAAQQPQKSWADGWGQQKK